MAEIFNFPGFSSKIASDNEEEVRCSRRYTQRGPTMQTVRFRSIKLILETDENDLARDIRFDCNKAKRKLTKIRQGGIR